MYWLLEYVCFFSGMCCALKFSGELYNSLRGLLAKNNLNKYGQKSWCVVTGATDGIGAGFARTLAKNGFNIVLVSRNQQKLEDFKTDLVSKYGIEARVIAKDFTACTENPQEFFSDIVDRTRDLDVSILVNNVGTAHFSYFHDTPLSSVLSQNALNIWPIVYLTRLYLPKFYQRSKPSAVINLASTGAILPISAVSQYTAGKSFDHVFTTCLWEENAYTVRKEGYSGVDVLSLQPAWVETPLTKASSIKLGVITPEECAERTLKVLGNATYSNVHWKHMLYGAIYRTIPTYLNAKLTLSMAKKKKNN